MSQEKTLTLNLHIGVKGIIDHFVETITTHGVRPNDSKESHAAFADLVESFADVIVSETIQSFVNQVSVEQFVSMRHAKEVHSIPAREITNAEAAKEAGNVH